MERLATVRQPSVLIVDEIYYLLVNATGAKLFFQLVNPRYEKASMVLTSKKSFKERGEIFGDSTVAAVLLAKLLLLCRIVDIKGNSYRPRHYPVLTLPDEEPAHRRRGSPRKAQEGSA